MKKVITYGTYDLLHYGHIKLLERAKALGDYLIVGVTGDDYDKTRGKINNNQSLMERIAAVENLGIADEVIVEEYEGQKIDDIKKYEIDIFTVGSDWVGKFDYLNEYCQVVYLPRTEGVSSSELRAEKNSLKIGIIGETDTELTSLSKFMREVSFVNGVEVACSGTPVKGVPCVECYDRLLQTVDAVYVASHPTKHYRDVKAALLQKKHVLCEAPLALNRQDCEELMELAAQQGCILMDGIKTAYTTAYNRLVLMAKTGKIGKILSVDATCTSRKNIENYTEKEWAENWNTITEWGAPALLPIFQILGTDYKKKQIVTKCSPNKADFDLFTKIDFLYENAVASIKVAKAAKSEGELIITGTDGYIYVPAPWWKTDYFEIRYENPANNKRYFYQLDGEGIRYEIVAFAKAIEKGRNTLYIDNRVTKAVCEIMSDFYSGKDVFWI
ncbi:MAG: adenylyltransferase/cytidyltransferase family protein [Clostridia bacterium]|nr:adenylyltransferase/cytidyltransferase family protein [Clostridia bacterium]